MNSGQFITDITVVSGKDKCPQGYTILHDNNLSKVLLGATCTSILKTCDQYCNVVGNRTSGLTLNVTITGNDANLYEGSFLKGGERYLCFSRILNSPTIVADFVIIKERDSVPTGFTAVKNCSNDSSEKSLRKHVLCLKTENMQRAASGVVNIVAVQPSKGEKFQGNFYTISNDVNGINICYQTIPNSHIRQPPAYHTAVTYRPPNVQPGYPGAGQALPYPSGQHRMPVPVSLQSTAPPTHNQPSSPSNKHTSAIQGVLFQVNPKFELLWKKPNISDKTIGDRTLDDIEKKYGYTFATEKSILSSR